MVLLTTTPRILSALSSLSPGDRSSLATADLPTTCGQAIEHTTLIAISRLSKTVTLNSLLRGTRVYVPPPPPKPPPSPEYVALMAKLRREQEQREYASLLSSSVSSSLITDREEEDDDDISPSLVLNIFLSIILCAAAVFYLTRWWANDGVRVLLSLATGIVVGVAEVGVYAAYLRKVKMSRDKERRKKERKVILGEYTGTETGGFALDAKGTPVSVDVNAIMEKEEIWGKGINGGMRRRVREKWQRDQEKVKT